MEQAYSVGTTNRYALFIDEEDDPGDVIAPVSNKQEKEIGLTGKGGKDASKQSKNVKGKENKEKSTQKQNKVVVLENVNQSTQSGEKPNTRRQGVRPNDRQGERLDNRKQNDERPASRGGRGGRQRLSSKEKDRENEFVGGGEERPSRGRGGQRPFRDRGSGRGTGVRTGKREFERRSGSDKSSIKAVDKRDGGGAHNWGRQNDGAVDDWPSEEPEAQVDTQEPVANGEDQQEQKELAEGQEGEGEDTTLEEEEELKEMTLDEYKAQQRGEEVLKPDSSLQRNVDNSQWKGTVALKKEDEEFFPGTREIIEKPKTSGRIKTTLDPNFYFKDPARRGRGRTGGPGGPGGRGSGSPREDRNPSSNRRSFDENKREGGSGRREFDGGRKEFESGRGRGFGDGGRGRGFGDGGRGRGFGDRGRGEGGRGRGFTGRGRNSNNRRDRAPNVEDESDFPSLGAC